MLARKLPVFYDGSERRFDEGSSWRQRDVFVDFRHGGCQSVFFLDLDRLFFLRRLLTFADLPHLHVLELVTAGRRGRGQD